MTYRRWEILLDINDFDAFTALMEEYECGGFSSSRYGNQDWIICYPPEEVILIATLKFRLTVMPACGIEVIFTDCPVSDKNIK